MLKPVKMKSDKVGMKQLKLCFEGLDIHVLMQKQMPWFDAADVCAVLGYMHVLQTLDDQVDDEDRWLFTKSAKPNGKAGVTYINTSGLFALILGNGKPKAKRFKRWVTSEVLPGLDKDAKGVAKRDVGVCDVSNRDTLAQTDNSKTSWVTKRDVGVASKSQMQLAFDNLPVRIEMDNGVAWFCAEDVCRVLGYPNSTQTVDDNCKTPWVSKRYVGVVTGKKKDGSDATQKVGMTFIGEPNLYRLIMKSRKPEAEKFEAWVMEEVLPSIRRTGGYQIPQQQQFAGQGGKQYQQVGPYVLNPALFARLFYALDKKLGCAALVYQLLRMEALDKWVVATIREISKGTDNAISYATVHKYARELHEQGLIDLQMRMDEGPKTTMFKIISEELALFLKAFPESGDLSPGLDLLGTSDDLVTVH